MGAESVYSSRLGVPPSLQFFPLFSSSLRSPSDFLVPSSSACIVLTIRKLFPLLSYSFPRSLAVRFSQYSKILALTLI